MLIRHEPRFRKSILSRAKAALLLSLLFVSIIVIPILQPTPTKAADPTTDEAFMSGIVSYTYYKALAYCLGQSNLHDDDQQTASAYNAITNENAISGNWFSPKGSFFKNVSQETMTARGVYFGKPGEVGCFDSSLVTDALKYLGYDPITVLCNSGFRRLNDMSGSVKACEDGSDYLQRINGVGGGPYDTGDKFKAFIPEPTLSGAQWYWFYRQSLANSCIPSINNGPTGAEYNPNDAYSYNTIRWVDGKGDIQTGAFAGSMKKTAGVIFSPGGTRGSNEYETKCSDIVAGMDQYVDEYAAWAKANPEAALAIEEGLGREEDGKPTCGNKLASVGWIVCPIINVLVGANGAMWGFVNGKLAVDPLTQEGSVVYTAWSSIRNLANIAFVIISLIMIFSQVSSIGLSNYGIKKLLPRLIIAAILVNLSYFIVQIAVDLSNIVGNGLYGLLTAQAEFTPNFETIRDLALGVVGVVGVGAVAVFAAGGALAAIMLLLPALGMFFLGTLAALLTLMFRQAAIPILAIIAPLAFVAYLLPNTESWFKKWTGILIPMLMLYPLAAVVFGAAQIASSILIGSDKGWWGNISGVMILCLPLFSLPFLARQGGAMLGKVSGALGGMAEKARKPMGAWAGKKAGVLKTSAELKAMNSTSKRPSLRRYMLKRNAQNAAIEQNQKSEFGHAQTEYISKEMGSNPELVRRMAQGGGKGAEDRARAKALAERTKLRQEEIANEVARMVEDSTPEDLIKNVGNNFRNAIKSGDNTKVQAAKNILLQTSKGRDEFGDILTNRDGKSDGIMDALDKNEEMSKEFRNDLNKLGLKGSAAAIAKLGYTKGTLTDMENNSDTYKSLTDTELLGQSDATLKRIKSQLSPETANRILASDTLKTTDTQRDILRSVAGALASAVPPGYTQASGGLIIPHSPPSPTPPAGTPPAASPPPSSTQSTGSNGTPINDKRASGN